MSANEPSDGLGSDGAALTEEASAWFARMHSDQVMSEDEAAFVDWLEADPRHRAAYEEVAAVWSGLGELRGRPEMRPLLAHLREGIEPRTGRRLDRRRLLQASVAGVGALGLAGAGWLGLSQFAGARTYETTFGEQRRVALEDGSTLTLNTETRVRVRFSEAERRLWLDRGQAYFIVASDSTRPFRLFVGDEEVRALGTQFEVRREGDGMKVTLEEGSVAIIRGASRQVLDGDAPAADAVLSPGQQAVVASSETIQVAAVDTRRVTAWRFGQMALDADPLSFAVAELNRYNTRQIVIDSPELQAMPISGLFQTGSPEAFVEAVSAVLPVEVGTQDERSIHLVYVGP